MTKHYEHYSMIIQWSDEDDVYIVMVPELPGCITHGATYEVAVQQGQDAIDSWIDAQRASGRPVPPPRIYPHIMEQVAG
jgi:predicted RNase H-like HicB family nuclease